MKLTQLAKDFEDTYLEVWNGASWTPRAIKGVFQVYDRFITERTFGVKKRIFLTSYDPLDTDEIVRTPDGAICLLEAATPDYEDGVRTRCSLLLRETNAVVEVTGHVQITNASGVATGQAATVTTTTWGDVGRYNANQSPEFAGIYHETDILMLPKSFSISLSSNLKVNGIQYKIAELDNLLRLREARVRRAA